MFIKTNIKRTAAVLWKYHTLFYCKCSSIMHLHIISSNIFWMDFSDHKGKKNKKKQQQQCLLHSSSHIFHYHLTFFLFKCWNACFVPQVKSGLYNSYNVGLSTVWKALIIHYTGSLSLNYNVKILVLFFTQHYYITSEV